MYLTEKFLNFSPIASFMELSRIEHFLTRLDFGARWEFDNRYNWVCEFINKHILAKVRRNKVLTMTERGSGSVSALLLRDCILTKWTKFWASNIGGGVLKAVVLVTTARSGHSPGAQLGCWKANMLKSKGPENACKIKLPHRVYALKEHSQC